MQTSEHKKTHTNHRLYSINSSPKYCGPKNSSALRSISHLPTVGNTNSSRFHSHRSKEGLAVSVINALVLVVYYPGQLSYGPIYNLIAVLSMMLGVYIPYKLATRAYKRENLNKIVQQKIKLLIITATALGIILRVGVTTITNYFALQQGPPIGFGLSPNSNLGLSTFNCFLQCNSSSLHNTNRNCHSSNDYFKIQTIKNIGEIRILRIGLIP